MAKRSVVADPMSIQYFSSGSEHDGEDDSVDGRDLSDLVRSFIEEDGAESTTHQPENEQFYYSDSDEDSTNPSSDLEDVLRNSSNVADDSFLLNLRAHVSKAVETFSSSRFLFRSNNKSVFRRSVMAYLRDSGFNAGICKSRWESSGGLAAGSYEFIDVIHQCSSISSSSTSSSMPRFQKPQQHQQIVIRYIVDLDFAGEFEIARPTPQYMKLIQLLPRVYVGRSEEMKKIVRLMCDEAKKSLKSRDLTLPPWRKNRYMQTKWFGPYRRTVNQTSSPSVKSSDRFNAVKCRAVGFNAVSNGPNGDGRFAVPATTRTR